MNIQANDPDILSLMKITDQNNNLIEWSYNAFPDGQVQIRILKKLLENVSELNVKVSLPNPIVLDLFNQFTHTFKPKNITINYLYGARCDKNESGDYWVCNVAIKEGIYNIGRAKYLAPHCDKFLHPDDVIYHLPDCVKLSSYDCVVFPDESAYKRYANQLSGKEYVICEKHRDQETGNIISHKVPTLPDGVKKVILLDDLCDYGNSFVNIGKTIPEGVSADLFIFHGVFTQNAPVRLVKYFDKIIVSNSLPHVNEMVKLVPEGKLIVFDVWS
jgi:hypothetical protein